jgi:putative aldouronate transport system permease protein
MLEHISRSRSDRLFDALNLAVMIFLMVLIVYPLLFVVFASLSDPRRIYDDPLLLWPKGFNLGSFQLVFENREVWTGYMNSIVYMGLGTFVNIAMTTLGAYPLSRKDFWGRGALTFFYAFTMFFSGGLIPLYLLVKKLAMLNTVWVMIIPGAVSVYNMVIMRTYFETRIPKELEDAARIDGCTNFRMLWKLILPLSMPIIAVMVLFYGVGHWNAYFNALVFLTSRQRYPLQMVLREILIQGEMSSMLVISYDEQYAARMVAKMGLRFAVIIVSALPIFIVYPLLRKFFQEGIMVGAIKG